MITITIDLKKFNAFFALSLKIMSYKKYINFPRKSTASKIHQILSAYS